MRQRREEEGKGRPQSRCQRTQRSTLMMMMSEYRWWCSHWCKHWLAAAAADSFKYRCHLTVLMVEFPGTSFMLNSFLCSSLLHYTFEQATLLCIDSWWSFYRTGQLLALDPLALQTYWRFRRIDLCLSYFLAGKTSMNEIQLKEGEEGNEREEGKMRQKSIEESKREEEGRKKREHEHKTKSVGNH